MTHKWWHFIYGKETLSEVVYEKGNTRTSNYWDICKKCKQQIGEKQGYTTFSLEFEIPIKVVIKQSH